MAAALRQKALKLSTRLLYCYFCDRANKAMCCWPTLDDIQADLGIARPTAVMGIRELETRGLIRVDRRYKQASVYHLVPIEELAELPEGQSSSNSEPQPSPLSSKIEPQTDSVIGLCSSNLATSAVQKVNSESLKESLKIEIASLREAPRPTAAAREDELDLFDEAAEATHRREQQPQAPSAPATSRRNEIITPIFQSSSWSSAVPEVPSVRKRLFGEGLAILRELTGKPEGPSRGLLGKWLRDVHDDASVVIAVLHEASSLHLAEPVAWISAAITQRTAGDGTARTSVPGGRRFPPHERRTYGETNAGRLGVLDGLGVDTDASPIIEGTVAK